MTQSWLG